LVPDRGTERVWHRCNDSSLYNANFGYPVAISGATVVVGSVGSSSHAGRVYVFIKSPTGWHQAVKLKGSDTASNDQFGWAVGLSGGTVVVGAPTMRLSLVALTSLDA
jgi:hypothetical protein